MRRRAEIVHRNRDGKTVMTKKRKRRKRTPVVPRLGPATNLRPAGAHASPKAYDRRKAKAALDREVEVEEKPIEGLS